MTGVSCRAANSCLVVGDYYKSTSATAPDFPLALELQRDLGAADAAVPVPKGASGVTLDAVSCTTQLALRGGWLGERRLGGRPARLR